MKKAISTLVLFGTFVIAGCAGQSNEALSLYQAGQTAYQQQDYHTAYTKLQMAAQKGNANAQYAVGYMLYNGIGVQRDQAAALLLFQKAAKQGQLPAVEALQRLNATAEKQAYNPAPS